MTFVGDTDQVNNIAFGGAHNQLGEGKGWALPGGGSRGERPAGIRSKFLAKRPQSGGHPL